jgi:hypothetical protein
MDDRRITTGGEAEEPFPEKQPPAPPHPRYDPYDRPEDEQPFRKFRPSVFRQDRQYLTLLLVFHFVLAGLAFFIGLCPLLGLGMGIWMVSGAFPTGPAPGTYPGSPPGPPPGPPMQMMGWLIIGEYALMLTVLYGAAILACVVGYFLKRRKRWLFCIVGSGIQCLFIPFGTILGVFTIIVLARESVKYVFQHGEPLWTDDEDYQ